NLKNTYGPARLEVGSTAIETGLLNLGSLIGDHAKTAIGTLLGTATVIGTGASVFGAVRPPKYVPPFAWGGSDDARMSREGFLRTAERVLPRRDVTPDAATRAMLARGARRGRAATPQPRYPVRPRRSRKPALHRDGAGRGPGPEQPHRDNRAARARAQARHRDRVAGRARLCARAWRDPPRHQ